MKKILHLSDLHFGTEVPGILDCLNAEIIKTNPDLIIVSGDLTQRALRSQFFLVKDFLNSLPQKPLICVPGNHDISLYNLIERFFYPLRRYKKYITDNMYPEYCD